MRLRLLVCLPLAALVTFLLLVCASSLVSALERSVAVTPSATGPMPVARYETVCERLFRELHALSLEVSGCSQGPACAASPLFCPAALDEGIDRDYRRLRGALHEQCDFPLALIDHAWQGASEAISEHRSLAGATLTAGATRAPDAYVFVDGGCSGSEAARGLATNGEAGSARYSF